MERRLQAGTWRRAMCVACMAAMVVFLMACSLLTPEEQLRNEQAVREDWQEQSTTKQDDTDEAEENKPEADQVLPEGCILAVRVRYGESVGTMCTVRIENPRNDWYDLVEYSSAYTLDSAGDGYDDFNFQATNFNQQITNEIGNPKFEDPKLAEGEYGVKVTSAGGYSASAKVVWDGQRFQPSMLAFSTD